MFFHKLREKFKGIKLVYILIALAFSLILFSQIKFNIRIKKDAADEFIDILIHCFGIIKIYLQIPQMIFEVKNFIPFVTLKYKYNRRKRAKKIIISHKRFNIRQLILTMSQLFNQIKRFNVFFRWLLQKVKVLKFKFNLSFGLDDPELMGIATGAIWTAMHFIMSQISRLMDFSNSTTHLNFQPDFINNEPVKIEFEGIFQLRAGYIIITSLVFLIIWVISKKSLKKTKGATNYG